MTPWRLALRDIARNEFRSVAVFLAAALVAGLVLAASLVLQGTGQGLRLTQDRLGADILVVPRGTAERVESALLMGTPVDAWMRDSVVDEIRAIPGVDAASPQMYLASLAGASCCSVSSMFIVAFDPQTDFTVRPWLEDDIGADLALGEAVGGAYVSVPEEGLRIYGYPMSLASNLEPTGGNLDQSMFVTLETARDVARTSVTEAVEPLEIPAGAVSSVLVRVKEGNDPGAVAGAILSRVSDVSAVMSPAMFDTFRDQIATLRSGLVLVLGLTVGLSLMLIAVAFAMAAQERRREVGVWRALGATRSDVAISFVAHAAVLAAAGGLVGAAFSAFGIYLFHDAIVGRIGVPFLFPSLMSLLPYLLAALLAAVMTGAVASLVPAVRASRQDPAIAMRE